ncbi:MAG: PH domain-containing protein [Candidatus Kerfeldbacteria bacterium]|nr:PH domain-containing protein [Candidatus Kerfeldbacteria bacterium]
MPTHRVDFPGMHGDEQILLLQRKHWSVLVHKLVRYVMLIVAPLLIFGALAWFDVGFTVDTQNLSGVLLILGASLYTLLLWMLFFHDWLDYYLDVLIVTNERVVRIEQKGLFNRTVADLTLDRVQDVTVETKGFVQTFLHYGSLHLQSAGERERFTFSDIPDPELVKAEILRYIRREGVSQSIPPPAASPPTPTGRP